MSHQNISIHAPLAGCDLLSFYWFIFLRISIHAPLAGCDCADVTERSTHEYFNPRTPCGVRPVKVDEAVEEAKFQSTHPLRGATAVGRAAMEIGVISIHAPLAGCDPDVITATTTVAISIHAPLAGCDAGIEKADDMVMYISIHAPLAGCDIFKRGQRITQVVFQSTHPLRGATPRNRRFHPPDEISIHAPLAGCDFTPSPFWRST